MSKCELNVLCKHLNLRYFTDLNKNVNKIYHNKKVNYQLFPMIGSKIISTGCATQCDEGVSYLDYYYERPNGMSVISDVHNEQLSCCSSNLCNREFIPRDDFNNPQSSTNKPTISISASTNTQQSTSSSRPSNPNENNGIKIKSNILPVFLILIVSFF